METEDLKDVELAHTGTFNASTGRIKFSREDFDDMVDAAKELAGKVAFPVKLGHNEKQQLLQEDGLPAAGWIENVRREGNSLIGDLMKVPAKIAGIIKAGGLRKRSIEAMRNAELAGQRFKFVLTGLALLGEELPAVDSLDDIVALYTSAKLDLPSASALTEGGKAEEAIVLIICAEHSDDDDDDDDDVEDLIKELQSLVGRADGLFKGRKGAPQLRHLVNTTVQELRRVGRKTKAKIGVTTDMEQLSREAIVKTLGLAEDVEDDAIEAAIKDLQSKVEAGEKGGADDGKNDAALADMKKTMETQASEILDLKNDKAKTEATDAANAAIKASKFAPAVRDNLIKLALNDPESFADLVKTTPVIAGMAPGVIGSSEDPETTDLSQFEPHADQAAVMAQMHISKDEFTLKAIADAEEIAGKELVSATVKASLAPKKAD